jgi:hypothetical protein
MECNSLEDKLNQIEEVFRNPNLLIETIREMLRIQEESLNSIQFKLNEMNEVKDKLKGKYEFKPSLNLFSQNEASLFGSIKLDGHWSHINSIGSQILIGEQQLSELIKLCEFSPRDKWSLLYRATRNGFSSGVFHSKCDGKSNTLTIFKAKESSYIFGGFTSVSWDRSKKHKSDQNAFIFSLTNKDNTPLKMKIDSNEHKYAIRCHPKFGPIFGSGDDIFIADNANISKSNYSRLGHSYKHPQYAFGTNEAKTFLAGSNRFQLDEIEVYQIE